LLSEERTLDTRSHLLNSRGRQGGKREEEDGGVEWDNGAATEKQGDLIRIIDTITHPSHVNDVVSPLVVHTC
jgi:hypothetical protein